MQSTGQPMQSTGQPMQSTSQPFCPQTSQPMLRPNNQPAMPMTNNFPNTNFPNTNSPRLSHPMTGNAGSRVSSSPFLTGGFTNVQSPRQPSPVFNQRPMQSSMRSSPVSSLAGGSNSGLSRANTLGGVNKTGSTGVNKAPDNLFSEFLPAFGDSSTSAGNQAQSTPVTAASMQSAPQPSSKTQSWTTFD